MWRPRFWLMGYHFYQWPSNYMQEGSSLPHLVASTKPDRAMPPSATTRMTILCHMVPCWFSHIQLWNRWLMGKKERTTADMDGQPHIHLNTADLRRRKVCAHLFRNTNAVNDHCVCASIWPHGDYNTSSWGLSSPRQRISPLSSQLVWWQQSLFKLSFSSSVYLLKMWPWGHTDF